MNKLSQIVSELFKRVGAEEQSPYQATDEQAKELGHGLYDYLICTKYDTDWDGYTELELTGVREFLQDLECFIQVQQDNSKCWCGEPTPEGLHDIDGHLVCVPCHRRACEQDARDNNS